MKKILLASAGVMTMSAGVGYAACIPTPSCSSLGYESSSSCEGGIKCPFGNAWNCTVINKVNEITNKVTEIEKVVEEGGGGNSSCQVGYLYYSDKTCSTARIPSKTLIGVVVYIDGKGHGQVMALETVGNYEWGGYRTDIPTLTNFTEEDIERGYLEVPNRKGIIEQFPITSISIGVVVVEKSKYANILEIGEVGAQVKHIAKTTMGSSYAINRRKK